MINKRGLLFKFYAPIAKTGVEIVKGRERFFLEGYAATSDLDRQDEIITISALKQGAKDLLANHAVFYEHKSDEHPIGKIVKTEVIEGEEGQSDKLYIKVYISETAETIRTLIKEGILDKFSIGGKVLKAETEFDEGSQKEVLKIYSMELYEVSVVGLPANVKAEAIGYEIHKSFKEGKICRVIDGIPVCKTKEDTEVSKDIEKKEAKEEVTKMAEKKEAKKTPELSEAQRKDIELYRKEDKVAEEAQKKEAAKKEEPKGEKTEKKEEAKKEVKAEETETPKEEAKKETTVEKKEEPKKKEEEVEPEAKKSEEAPKDDKTTKEKPEEKKEEVIVKQEEEEETPVKCPECGKEIVPVDGKCPECGAEIKSEEEEVEYYDIADILAALKALQKDVTEMLSLAKADKEAKKSEEPKVDVEAEVEKAIEKKLGNVRVVPTRKGLIIRENKEEKLKGNKDAGSPLEILSDEEGFAKLDEKTKKKVVRKGLLQIMKNTSILNETDDGE